MQPNDATAIASRLMSGFATRTGLSSTQEQPQRYLWTDAFAVCNFLELFVQTGDEQYRRCATELIDQVHRVLGRYRDDDNRSGWISGLDEHDGGRHPMAGGLRIGKPLRERSVNEVFDEMLEWDRDGQYFHYLTKWIHSLCQTAFVTNNFKYALWAVELGKAGFKGFSQRSGSGRVIGVYWKMSTDLSRPLVPATGLHDALDGLITFEEAQHALTQTTTEYGEAALSAAIESLSLLCKQREWTTDDPLGLGGLLFDAGRLCQLSGDDHHGDLLEGVLQACAHGMMSLLASGYLDRPVSHRLAFRELGLAIGLQTLPLFADVIEKGRVPYRNEAVEQLLSYKTLGDDIISLWLPHAQSTDETWQSHRDINDVMLATALIPNMFLSIGLRGHSGFRGQADVAS